MIAIAKSVRGAFGLSVVAALLLAASAGQAQDELRDTFFRDVDAAKAAADSANAELLAPRSYSRGLSEYEDAEEALERGRNIETVRKNAADARRWRRY